MRIFVLSLFFSLLFAMPATAKVTAQQKCDSLKLIASAKLAQCRLVALAKHEKKPDEVRRDEAFAKCESKFQTVYDKAELKFPEDASAADADQCSTYGNAASIRTNLDASADAVLGIVTIPVGATARLVSGEDFTCWLSDAGGVWCLGWGDYGQLGDGNFSRSPDVAVQPLGLDSGVIELAVGEQHACAIKDDGALWCWGENNDGQIGDGTDVNAGSPVEVFSSEYGIVQVGLGEEHSCAVDQSGAVHCWGSNGSGQTGIANSGANVLAPVVVGSLSVPMRAVYPGSRHTCALGQDGSVACWGSGADGRLGSGSDEDSIAPVWVEGLSEGNVTRLDVGWNTSCATVQDGSLYCWGDNDQGQLGIGTTDASNVPVEVTALGLGVQTFSAGYRAVCAVDNQGALFCWGRGSNGVLGNGAEEDSATPVRVGGVLEYAGEFGSASVIGVDVAGNHTACAVTDTDGRYCWGRLRWGDEVASDDAISSVDVSSPELMQLLYAVDP